MKRDSISVLAKSPTDGSVLFVDVHRINVTFFSATLKKRLLRVAHLDLLTYLQRLHSICQFSCPVRTIVHLSYGNGRESHREIFTTNLQTSYLKELMEENHRIVFELRPSDATNNWFVSLEWEKNKPQLLLFTAMALAGDMGLPDGLLTDLHTRLFKPSGVCGTIWHHLFFRVKKPGFVADKD